MALSGFDKTPFQLILINHYNISLRWKMAIYRIIDDKLAPIKQTAFALEGLREREDLQQLLKERIDVISPDTLVLSEEFGGWQDSRRRIDLLGIDKDANLVVIELKRNEDGGHMDLQSIRYAAMASTLTFRKAVDIFASYLNKNGKDDDPQTTILEFLELDEPNEESFGQDVRIVLASAEFSKEITTSVIWLNDHGLDIRCIRLKPYRDGDYLLLDVQQIIPLPEAAEYQIQLRDKARQERTARRDGRDFTKYDVILGEKRYERLPKRWAVFQIVKYLCDSGINPDDIIDLFSWRANAFRYFDGDIDSDTYIDLFTKENESMGRKSEATRYFCDDDQLIYANGKTYAFTKMWGESTVKALESLTKIRPDLSVEYQESDN